MTDKIRIFEGGGTQDTAGNPSRQIILERLHVADPASELHFQPALGGNGKENVGVDPVARPSAVQIHHMDPLRTRPAESSGGFQRIIGHGVRRAEIPLDEADALAVLDVDSR